MAIKAGDVIVIDSGKYLVTDLWQIATIYDRAEAFPNWQFPIGQSFRAINLTNNGGQYDLATFDEYGDSWIVDWEATIGFERGLKASDQNDWRFGDDGISNCIEKVITIIPASAA